VLRTQNGDQHPIQHPTSNYTENGCGWWPPTNYTENRCQPANYN
jgi:hypothetical protein